MKKEFEFAAIFSASDVKNDFIGCIASIADEGCDETAILVESQQSIDRIANTYEDEKQVLHLHIYGDAAKQYGINVEAIEALFNVAAIVRNRAKIISFEESLKIITAITENYNISHK